MRKAVVVASLFLTLAAYAQQPRLDAQNALFKEYWEATLKLNPMIATLLVGRSGRFLRQYSRAASAA